MAIECVRCGHSSNEVCYREPPYDKHIVRVLRVLLVAVAVLAVGSSISTFMTAADISDALDELRGLAEETAGSDSLFYEAAIMASNAALLLALVALGIILFLIVRYIWVFIRVRRGSPRALRMVRFIAVMTIGFWVAKWFALSFILVDTSFSVVFDPWDAGVLLGITLLAYTFNAPVKVYFNSYRLVALPAVATAAAPIPGGVPPDAGPTPYPAATAAWAAAPPVPAMPTPTVLDACGSCGAPLRGDTAFCVTCGAMARCPTCARVRGPREAHCRNCGTRLGAAA